ncbi:hypothetical protein, partial [Escherichia coli]|uniref:hypothetical protein n=1 Tax=Escherichia coli TaxID=562 RepID=UPI00289D8B5A
KPCRAGRPVKYAPAARDQNVVVGVVSAHAGGVWAGVRASARTFTLTLTLSLKGEGTDRAQILRDIFFCLVTEEQKIGLLRLNIAEKKHGRE